MQTIRRSVIATVAVALSTCAALAGCGGDDEDFVGTASVRFGSEEFTFDLTECFDTLAIGVGNHPEYGPTTFRASDSGTLDSMIIGRDGAEGESGPGWFYITDLTGKWPKLVFDNGSADAEGLPVWEHPTADGFPGGPPEGVAPIGVAQITVRCSYTG